MKVTSILAVMASAASMVSAVPTTSPADAGISIFGRGDAADPPWNIFFYTDTKCKKFITEIGSSGANKCTKIPLGGKAKSYNAQNSNFWDIEGFAKAGCKTKAAPVKADNLCHSFGLTANFVTAAPIKT